MGKVILKTAVNQRNNWIKKINHLNDSFVNNSKYIENELINEIKKKDTDTLINHLRLCVNIPESFRHDSSEEKQYSKYTDYLLALAFKSIGLKSLVLTERADVADVEGYTKKFSFVADAKAFRLSRTAKNQKDFKVQAMDGWKHGKPYAMIVCPIYQLPSKNSQIYQQAISRNVCIFTYSHLSLLVRYSQESSTTKAISLLLKIFKTVPALIPSKSAVHYWLAVNSTMLNFSKVIPKLWQLEKIASLEAIEIGKKEALKFLAAERNRILNMSHDDALNELLKAHKIESKIEKINGITTNNLLDIIE